MKLRTVNIELTIGYEDEEPTIENVKAWLADLAVADEVGGEAAVPFVGGAKEVADAGWHPIAAEVRA